MLIFDERAGTDEFVYLFYISFDFFLILKLVPPFPSSHSSNCVYDLGGGPAAAAGLSSVNSLEIIVVVGKAVELLPFKTRRRHARLIHLLVSSSEAHELFTPVNQSVQQTEVTL